MNYIVVTQEWLAARNILPLSTMRKSKDGTKYLAHEDFFNAFKTKNEEDEEALEGLTLYPHNSNELNELLASEEWSGEGTSGESADYVQVAAVKNLMTATKANIQNYSMKNKEVNDIVDMLPKWEDLIGQSLPIKYKLQYGGKPYRTNQAHTPQKDWKPDTVKSLYGLMRWLVLEKGMYYTQDGAVYKCTVDAANGYDSDLTDLLSLLEKVV